jgi:hypothetical protein
MEWLVCSSSLEEFSESVCRGACFVNEAWYVAVLRAKRRTFDDLVFKVLVVLRRCD